MTPKRRWGTPTEAYVQSRSNHNFSITTNRFFKGFMWVIFYYYYYYYYRTSTPCHRKYGTIRTAEITGDFVPCSSKNSSQVRFLHLFDFRHKLWRKSNSKKMIDERMRLFPGVAHSSSGWLYCSFPSSSPVLPHSLYLMTPNGNCFLFGLSLQIRPTQPTFITNIRLVGWLVLLSRSPIRLGTRWPHFPFQQGHTMSLSPIFPSVGAEIMAPHRFRKKPNQAKHNIVTRWCNRAVVAIFDSFLRQLPTGSRWWRHIRCGCRESRCGCRREIWWF